MNECEHKWVFQETKKKTSIRYQNGCTAYFEKYWWNCKCSEFTIYSNNGFETEEGAIKDWNDFCETLVTLYADGHRDGYIDGYIKGYDDGYEKGWQAND